MDTDICYSNSRYKIASRDNYTTKKLYVYPLEEDNPEGYIGMIWSNFREFCWAYVRESDNSFKAVGNYAEMHIAANVIWDEWPGPEEPPKEGVMQTLSSLVSTWLGGSRSHGE